MDFEMNALEIEENLDEIQLFANKIENELPREMPLERKSKEQIKADASKSNDAKSVYSTPSSSFLSLPPPATPVYKSTNDDNENDLTCYKTPKLSPVIDRLISEPITPALYGLEDKLDDQFLDVSAEIIDNLIDEMIDDVKTKAEGENEDKNDKL
jgi:hypothetical protein